MAKKSPEHLSAYVAEFFNIVANQFDDEKLLVTGAVLFAPTKRDGDYYVSEQGGYYSKGFHESVVANAQDALGYPRHPKKLPQGGIEERDAGDAIYSVLNPRLVQENGIPKVLGDLQFFEDCKKHYQRMKRAHKRLGLSIFAPTDGRKDYAINEYIAEKIDEASHLKLTVDFGEAPSATKNVFEFGQQQHKENADMDQELQKQIDDAIAANSKIMSEKFTSEIDKVKQENADLRRKQLVTEKIAGKPAHLVTESLISSLTTCAEDKMDGLVKEHFEKLGRTINPVTGMGGDGTDKGHIRAERGLSIEQRIEIGATRGVHAIVSEMGTGAEQGEPRLAKMWDGFVAEFGWLGDGRYIGGKWTKMRAEMLQGWNPRLLTKAMLGKEPQKGLVREAAIMSTSFQNINNLLLAATVIARYEILEATKFVDQLFTSYQSSKELETWPGYTAPTSTLAVVAEGAEYPDVEMEEKYAQDVRFGKYGAKVRITEEELLFDQPGQVMMRANRIVDTYALLRARQIVRSLYDATGWECYRPNGAQTDLWTGTNTLADNPLVDYTSLWPVRAKLRNQVDENGNRIDQGMNPLTLVIPVALEDLADILKNASMAHYTGATTATHKTMDIRNPFMSTNIISSTLLDDINEELYGDADNTYFAAGPLGFADQFVLKKHFPFGAENLPDAEVKRVSTDTVGGVRVRYKERLFAIDNKRVVRVLKGTTS